MYPTLHGRLTLPNETAEMARPRYLEKLEKPRENVPSASERFITIVEFAEISHLSRRQIHRLRTERPPGFPAEYELGTSANKYRRTPRFKLSEVLAWMDSRAAW